MADDYFRLLRESIINELESDPPPTLGQMLQKTPDENLRDLHIRMNRTEKKRRELEKYLGIPHADPPPVDYDYGFHEGKDEDWYRSAVDDLESEVSKLRREYNYKGGRHRTVINQARGLTRFPDEDDYKLRIDNLMLEKKKLRWELERDNNGF